MLNVETGHTGRTSSQYCMLPGPRHPAMLEAVCNFKTLTFHNTLLSPGLPVLLQTWPLGELANPPRQPRIISELNSVTLHVEMFTWSDVINQYCNRESHLHTSAHCTYLHVPNLGSRGGAHFNWERRKREASLPPLDWAWCWIYFGDVQGWCGKIWLDKYNLS